VTGTARSLDRKGLGEPEQLPPDGVDLREQAARQVVGVDLVAGEEELLRAPRQVQPVLGDEVVEVGHRVGTGGVRSPARAWTSTRSLMIGAGVTKLGNRSSS
jgi:hypothetical protein